MKYASLAVFLAIWGCHSTILSTIQETRYGIKRKESPAFELQVHVDLTGTSVHIDGTLVYHYYNKTMLWGNRTARLHAGMHQIAINERSGEVMRMDSFMTWQPRLYQDAVVAFNNIQDGRYVVLVGVPDFTEGLEKELEEQISSEGSLFIDRLAYEEAWVLVVRKNRSVLAEAAAIKDWRTNRDAQMDASPLVFSAVVPLLEGTSKRISYQMKFCLKESLKVFPEALAVIVLEDDLDLAPDFISFFRQSLVLLQEEESLFCVNAFNRNAYRHVSHDFERLYRTEGVPSYGWMVTSATARDILSQWPQLEKMENYDWDFWVRSSVMGNRTVLVPEVPRTKHTGGGGVHVTGLEQLLVFDRINFNHERSHVTLDIESAREKNYVRKLYEDLRLAEVVKVTLRPCEFVHFFDDKTEAVFVIYILMPDESDPMGAYRVMAKCFGLNDVFLMEHLHLLYLLHWKGNLIYIVGCPTSVFCLTRDVEVVYMPSADDILQASKDPFFRLQIQGMIRLRESPSSLLDEINMANIASLEMVQSTNATSVVLV